MTATRTKIFIFSNLQRSSIFDRFTGSIDADFCAIVMATMGEWLQRLRDYGQRVANDYTSAGQQYSGLGNELRARGEMTNAARVALGQVPPPAEPLQPAPVALAPYERVNPGYRPIGGANALRQTLQGQPPKLR